MKKILVDTNAYTALMTGDERVLDSLVRAETVYVSVIVMGELYAGFYGGGKSQENRNRLSDFLTKPGVKVLHCTPDTAERFGIIQDRLRRAGTPIPINDVWIAAHAMESGAQLITYDSHFRKVAGLVVWNEL